MAITPDSNTLLSSKRTLIIDDFQGMRSMLREMLKSFGAKDIDMASYGNEAIIFLEKNKYDIVLCDYNLGTGKNGQQLLEEAKIRNLIGPATAWIMVTAEKTSDMVLGAAEYTPDDYIIKPVNETTIKTRVMKALAKRAVFSTIEKAIRGKDYMRAITLCDEQIKNGGNNVTELLRMKTNLLLTVGRYDKAKQIFEQILAQRDVPWAKTGLAKTYFHTGEYELARDLLTEVVADNRAYLEGYDWLAKSLEKIGELGEAQRILARSTELSPNSLMRQKTLGDIAHKRGDVDEAEKAFRKTIALGEYSILKNPATYVSLAKICAGKNNPAEALKVLGRIHKEFDSNEASLQAKVVAGLVHSQSGDTASAEKIAQEISDTLKDSASKLPTHITVEAAQLLMETGDKTGASELLEIIVKNNHENESLIKEVTQVFAKANMGEDGRKLIEKSRRETVETNNKGVTLAREGKLTEAVEWLRHARTLLPNNKRILLNLAYVMITYMKKNGRDNSMLRETRECLDRVIKQDPGEKKCGQLLEMLESLPS